MFTYIRVKNFKSLIDFSIDFRNNRNKTKNLVVIYGENGSGKTNIVEVFEFLKRVFSNKNFFLDFSMMNKKEVQNISLFNYDSFLNQTRIENIINDYKTIDSIDNMFVECEIKIGRKYFRYVIETDDKQIVSEKLLLTKENDFEVLFEISMETINIKKITGNAEYEVYLNNEVNKYWGKYSFISIIMYEFTDKVEKYIKLNVEKNIINIVNYFFSYMVYKQLNRYYINYMDINTDLYVENIYRKKIDAKYLNRIEILEKILNMVIIPLYSDIKEVYYKKKIEEESVEITLYCRKIVGQNILDIEFGKESTGTQKLFKLIPLFVDALLGKTVIIDEFDTGIHDLMVKVLLENFAYKIKGQLILTTHNTTLMESNVKKDSFYILDILPNRSKEAVSIADYEKLHPNKNIRKRYLSGLYGGIPYASCIDFDEIEELIANAKY